MTEKEKLNEKLAKFAGFYWHKLKAKLSSHESFATEIYQREGWHYPDDSNCFDLPDFSDSLDACFKWLVPKLWKIGYKVLLAQYDDEIYQTSLIKGYEGVSAKDKIPALSLCLAVEKIVDFEPEGESK